MANEIEHKYLVNKPLWRPAKPGILYRQGYLSSVKERVVRIRIANERAYLTVKGLTTGITRMEFEYEVPLADASIMLDRLCERPLIEKTRYTVEFDGHKWEIDEFHGDNDGLLLAEIEVKDKNELFAMPPWVGVEVSSDPRYFSSNLGIKPYKTWNK